MKKLILMFLFPLAMMSVTAQNNSSVKKFQFGVGLGAGLLTNETSVVNASLELQGEVKATHGFSLYSDLAYNRLFSFSSEGGSGYASLLVGPRAWFSDKFFIGMGGGIAFFAGGGGSDAAFDYNPHIGVNSKKAQFTLGYNGITENGDNIGFVQLRAIIKMK